MYKKDFDTWNQKKKQVEQKFSDKIHLHEREVWWCSVGVNVGVEIDGKNGDFERPVLVVKKFNQSMFWGIPLTSKSKEYPTVIAVKHGAELSFGNLAQMRLLSAKRLLRKVDTISRVDFQSITSKLRSFLS